MVFNSPKFPVYLINNEGELNKALAFGYIYSRSGPQLCFQLLLFDKALHAFLKFYYNLFVFIERGGEREREERNINVCLPLMHPQLGTWPTTQVCALTGNPTGDPLVCRPSLNPLSHARQGTQHA